jgi:hypothetical protein
VGFGYVFYLHRLATLVSTLHPCSRVSSHTFDVTVLFEPEQGGQGPSSNMEADGALSKGFQ